MKYIICFLLLTGARKNEVLTAKWKDIDLQTKIWTIPITKAAKVRRIPITSQLEQIILQIPRVSNEYIFYNPKTKAPIQNIFFQWKQIRDKAKLHDVRIHDLRHTFASTLVNSGRSLYEVQQLLGHSDMKVTQRYSHLSNESLQSAVDCAGRLLE